MERIKYVCKNCGWTTHIRAEWGDIRPKRCPVKRCNTNFLAFPEKLEIHRPGEPKQKQVLKISKPIEKAKESPAKAKVEYKEARSENVTSSSKKKRGSKVVKQQASQGKS